MERKIERVFRNGPLTAAEVARDSQVRNAITREFPPATGYSTSSATRPANDSSLSDLVRNSIRESGLSLEEIAGAANVQLELLQRFMTGERDIHLHTADRLAEAVQLKLSVG